jgi:hypothetical protein
MEGFKCFRIPFSTASASGFNMWFTPAASPALWIPLLFHNQAKYSLILLTFQFSSLDSPQDKWEYPTKCGFDKFLPLNTPCPILEGTDEDLKGKSAFLNGCRVAALIENL